jgi:predicted AlkP superfamily pyrophosphatase or phosphodiesterase
MSAEMNAVDVVSSERSNPAKDTISLVIFIDALGWEVLRDRKFLESELPHRRKLRSVFGFSSACVPSILTGRNPRDHGHWSYFYYSPETSPFRVLKPLALLPAALTERGRVRHLISKIVGRLMRFTGYFQLYNLPFRHAGLFDHCEKSDIFKPGGMNNGENIFDVLERHNVSYHVSNWRDGETDNLEACEKALAEEDIQLAFLYMASMDGLLHQVGKDSSDVDTKLDWYEQQLRRTLSIAKKHYQDVRVFICSDHGMATVDRNVDLMSRIESLPLKFGKDYVAVYDSTMARFWFMKDAARQAITEELNLLTCGKILSASELQELGCDFTGNQFGETIFLLDPGTIIVPSHMGLNSITGMHGYHPDHEDSDAALLSNVKPTVEVENITDIFRLMQAEVGLPTAA